jgi:hypothetical protein
MTNQEAAMLAQEMLKMNVEIDRLRAINAELLAALQASREYLKNIDVWEQPGDGASLLIQIDSAITKATGGDHAD